MIPGMIPVALLGSTVYLVRETTVAVPFKARTADSAHRVYNLHVQSSRMKNKWLKPRSALPSSKRVSSTSNLK